jgi:hypothetical protein
MVVFVCKKDVGGNMEPCGTAFLVGVPARPGGPEWRYFVTAKHNVTGSEETFVRLRRLDGGQGEPIAIKRWEMHATSDVAVAPCDVPDTRPYKVDHASVQLFADRWGHGAVYRGDLAHFVGLLANVESMRERDIPMVRSGRVGALLQTQVPMEDNGRRYEERVAHLLDSHSVGGFSGSPCFIEKPMIVATEHGPVIGSSIALWGVVIGHFSHAYAGVAVVVPIEAVAELLEETALVDWRNEKDAERVSDQ